MLVSLVHYLYDGVSKRGKFEIRKYSLPFSSGVNADPAVQS
jgi:hypothetical protein